MLFESLSSWMQLANPTANSTASSLVIPSPSATAPNMASASTGVTNPSVLPSTDGVIEWGGPVNQGANGGGQGGGGFCPNGAILYPVGVGSDNATMSLYVYAWHVTGQVSRWDRLWIPSLLASFLCTLSARTGVNNTPLGSTTRFCDTITLGVGNANVSNEIISPGSDSIGSIALDAKGARFLEFRYGTGGSATSCNCLVGRL